MNIRQIHSKDVSWINVGSPKEEELALVKKLISAHPQDIKDCLPPVQRPKLVSRNSYLFCIFQFPLYNRQTKKIEPAEVDFFLTPKQLIMVHDSRLAPLEELFQTCSHDTKKAQHYLSSPSRLFTSILELLFSLINPMLNHISLDIDSVEERLLDRHNRQVIHEILVVKRNIVNFRKIMQAHKSVLEDIAKHGGPFFPPSFAKQQLPELIHMTIEIWDSLKNYEDAISAIHDSHTSLVSVRQSEIIKTLTIISVLTFPLTLIATLFAIDPKGGMPFLRHPSGFWIVVSILFFIALGMLIIFRKKRWI